MDGDFSSFAVIELLGMEHKRNSNRAYKRARCAGATADLQVLRTRGKSNYTGARMYPARINLSGRLFR